MNPAPRLRRGAALLVAAALMPIAPSRGGPPAVSGGEHPPLQGAHNQAAAPGTPAGIAAHPVEKPAPKPATAAGPPPPKNLEPLPPGRYTGVLGKDVAGPDGKDLGPIVDVVVNVDGTPRAAVIDFGGFLGVGSRKIAVDWRLLNFAPARPDGQIWLSLDRAEIQAAPEYRPGAVADEMVGPPWAASSSPGNGK